MNGARDAQDFTSRFPQVVRIRARMLGERLDTRVLERDAPLGIAPLALGLPGDGVVVLFRYGAAVFFNTEAAAEAACLARLGPLLSEPLPAPEADEARLHIVPEGEDHIEPGDVIVLRDARLERLQAVATVLAKSLVLAHYEIRLAEVFDRIEPLAAKLATKGQAGAEGRELVRHIGRVLLTQHRMVGRAEIGETPELLWEHPELERLYGRLAEEHELRERDRALDRKLDLIARTLETLLGLVRSRSSMRVEWYILALILAELLLSLFPPGLWR